MLINAIFTYLPSVSQTTPTTKKKDVNKEGKKPSGFAVAKIGMKLKEQAQKTRKKSQLAASGTKASSSVPSTSTVPSSIEQQALLPVSSNGVVGSTTSDCPVTNSSPPFTTVKQHASGSPSGNIFVTIILIML